MPVSPGLTSRPSLSVVRPLQCWQDAVVSPGLTSRPSLSVVGAGVAEPLLEVSPGLTSRPSLSAAFEDLRHGAGAGVAGVNLPAFVERRTRMVHWVVEWQCRRG